MTWIITEIAKEDSYYRYGKIMIGAEIEKRELISNANTEYESIGGPDFFHGSVWFAKPTPHGLSTDDYYFAGVKIQNKKEEIIKMRSPEEVRKELNEYAAGIDPARLKPIPKGLKGKLVGELNARFGGANNRYYVIGWLFTGAANYKMHTAQLTDAQIAALLHWLAPKHEADGWAKNPAFIMEASLMYAYVAKMNLKAGADMQLSQTLLDAIQKGE